MKIKTIPKYTVYLLLVLAASIPLFIPIKMPNKPVDSSAATFKALMTLEKGDTVLLGTDWTGSTRGESKAELIAILRILMRKEVKFAMWSSADAQSPRCAQDVITEVNAMMKKEGSREYKQWEDWVQAGFYPNSDVAINNVGQDVKKMFGPKRGTDLTGKLRSVMESPVLEKIQKIEDFKLVIDVTASKTSDFHVQFISSHKVPMIFAVTGVMVPETDVYYNSGQIAGFLGGLKGVYDVEVMMDKGLNVPDKDGKIEVASTKITDQIAGFPGKDNTGSGSKYYPTLHFALALMIILVFIGNLEMAMARKGAKNS
ncbi:MAG: hypothetical protein WCG75_00500 [Armatimonadota bacterium]